MRFKLPKTEKLKPADKAKAAGTKAAKVTRAKTRQQKDAKPRKGTDWTDPVVYATTRNNTTADAMGLNPKAYVDQDFFNVEQRQIFQRDWFCVGHVGELKPKSYKTVDVGSQSIIITKDKHGKVYAFHNSCRHRGARLCDSSGEAPVLACPYHWWTYGLDGRLIGAPFFDETLTTKADKKAFCAKNSLLPLQVELFHGLIFVNCDNSADPLWDQLGDIRDRWDGYPMAEMDVVDSKYYGIAADWKLLAENFLDYYHVPAVHPELAKFSTFEQHKAYQGEGRYCAFVTEPVTDSGGAADTTLFHPTPSRHASGLPEKYRTTAYFYHIYPNVSVTCYPHSVYLLIMLPDKVGRAHENLLLLQHPESRREEDDDETHRLKQKALMDFVCQVNDEDVTIVERLARGLTNEAYPGGIFAPIAEQAVHRFQNFVIDGMTCTRPSVVRGAVTTTDSPWDGIPVPEMQVGL